MSTILSKSIRMKNSLLLLFSIACLQGMCQSNFKTEEIFMGVPILRHHTILKAGDSLHLPAGAYIMEMIVIQPGDYTVYSDNEPMVYPKAPGVKHVIHRNEGNFEMEDGIQEKIFDINGSEKYPDQAIISQKGSFHVYFFTLATNTKISWRQTIEENKL